jgi:glycine/D-amino acid oxidase-like deaminating enzyme/nitrite reductase/ring-hydroxylating ferredoxin subunit
MSVYLEKSRSCWMDIRPLDFPKLDENLTCDVAVIGSGIAGLSTAYELARAGKSVVVLDRGPIGRGMTARTTAHITTNLDDYFFKFIERRGEEAARLFHAGQAAAADRIEGIASAEEIDCDFARVEARWFLTKGLGAEEFDREWEAMARVGLSGVARVAQVNGQRLSDGPAMIVPRQGRFHPLKYLDGLAKAVKRLGGKIYANTCATKIEELKTVVHIETDAGHRISTPFAVIATNAPIKDDKKITHRQEPYRTYAMAVEAPRGAIEDALHWDTEQPYHYVRMQPGREFDLLIAGGEDHGSGKADDAERRFTELEAWTRQSFPEIGKVRFRWSGQVLEPEDGIGFIGPQPTKDGESSHKLFIITGDSGQGIAHGVVASLILRDLVEGHENPWAAIYALDRKPPRDKSEKPYGDEQEVDDAVSSEDELSPGEGGILKHGRTDLAISRDAAGQMHRISAKCTHEGCTVKWNSFEQCWDCPCHGSHFAPDGTALNAPAVEPLKPAPKTAEKASAKSAQ